MRITKLARIFLETALILLVATGARAETYSGVHNPLSTKAREHVDAEAVQAASAPDQNVVRGSRGPEVMAFSKDRAIVEAEAIRAASAPDQNVGSGSRVNSKVISTMPHPLDVRAEAK